MYLGLGLNVVPKRGRTQNVFGRKQDHGWESKDTLVSPSGRCLTGERFINSSTVPPTTRSPDRSYPPNLGCYPDGPLWTTKSAGRSGITSTTKVCINGFTTAKPVFPEYFTGPSTTVSSVSVLKDRGNQWPYDVGVGVHRHLPQIPSRKKWVLDTQSSIFSSDPTVPVQKPLLFFSPESIRNVSPILGFFKKEVTFLSLWIFFIFSFLKFNLDSRFYKVGILVFISLSNLNKKHL